MTPLAQAMLVLFIAACGVAFAAHLYFSRYWYPMWAARFRKREAHRGYGKKCLQAFAVFLVAIAIAFAAGGIAEYWGGGWQ